MSKDPAFLFYSSDFLTGCSDLTMEERGFYITLMALQHQKGRLHKKTIWLSLGYSLVIKFDEFDIYKNIPSDVLKKFTIDDKGDFYNERLEQEINKRASYTDSRRANGSKGGRPKKPKENHMDNLCESIEEAYKNLPENENGNINGDINNNQEIKKIDFEKIDPYMNPYKTNFEKKYEEVIGQKPYLMNTDCNNLMGILQSVDNFEQILPEALTKLKNLNFAEINFNPSANWLLKDNNFAKLMNGEFDGQIKDESSQSSNESLFLGASKQVDEGLREKGISLYDED